MGSVYPAAFRSNRPPNPPNSGLAPCLIVLFASGLMASTKASPASISTPASRYVSPVSFLSLVMLVSFDKGVILGMNYNQYNVVAT